jgi:hypothetical protein
MDMEQLERRLERSFTARPQPVADCSITWRRKPALLWRFVEACLDAEEREEEPSLNEWPGNVSVLLENQLVDVLGFAWDGWGPISSGAGINLLVLEQATYVCHWDEMHSYRAVAKLDGPVSRRVLSAVVPELVRENGRRVGIDIFGSLPTETINHQPDRLPTVVVKQAYFDWLQAAQVYGGTTWADFAAEHYSSLVEPNHLVRCLDMLKTLPRLDDAAGWDEWERQREEESARIPDHARQRLFNEWFYDHYYESIVR